MKTRTPLTRSRLRRQQARDIVLRYTALATGSMWIPVPGLDVAAELGLQLRMVQQLCALYGAPFTATEAREVITGIVDGLPYGAVSAAALRYLSFASYFMGSGPAAAMTAAYTYTVGEMLQQRLERHGSIRLLPAAAPA